MSYKLIKDLVVDEQLEQVCLVSSVESKSTKTGRPFVKVTIKDNSGTLAINIWQTSATDIADLKPGVFAAFNFKVEEFKGMKSASAPPPMIVKAPEDMAPYQNQNGLTDEQCEKYYTLLLDAKRKVSNVYIKAFLDMLFDDPIVKLEFCRAPASATNRGAYRGGLVEHVAKVMMNAYAIMASQRASHINAQFDEDIVIAGVLMHDYGKMYTYRIDENGVAQVTRKGILHEHLPISYAMSMLVFDRLENQILHKDVPEEIKDHIHHCILSHHGKLEHGSPVTPKSLEAQIVHAADLSDSTVSNYAEPTKANASMVDANGFVEGNRFSNRQLFIGKRNG